MPAVGEVVAPMANSTPKTCVSSARKRGASPRRPAAARFLPRAELDARELEEILRRLRELEDSRIYKDVEELLALQSFVSEGIKRFEFTLRRKAR